MSTFYKDSLHHETLDKMINKDTECRNLLYEQIRRLKSTETELNATLEIKSAHLQKLKEDFLHNLAVINERDDAIRDFERQIEDLSQNLHSRDLIISELRADLDRAQADLSSSKTTEKELKKGLEIQRRESEKVIAEVQKQYQESLSKLRQSEAHERTQLQSTINRLHSDLEAEKLRFNHELEEALENSVKQRQEAENDATQKIFGLQLRLQLAEEVAERATKSKIECSELLESKEKVISEQKNNILHLKNTIDSLTLQLQDIQTSLKVAEQKYKNLEDSQCRTEQRWSHEKEELLAEIKQLKAQVEWSKQELGTAVSKHEEASAVATMEIQRLHEALEREKQDAVKAAKLIQEEKEARQCQEREARKARAESARLREDLEQALIRPPVGITNVPVCKHEHLLEQLNGLQNSCERLENENKHLRSVISTMSEQAMQVAQSTPEPNVDNKVGTPTTDSTWHAKTSNDTDVKLLAALKQIQQLALEKKSLIQLSNRLQAKLRRFHNNGCGNCHETVEMYQTEVRSNMQRHNSYDSEHKSNKSADKFNKRMAIDDGISSVTGKESISVVFRLLEETNSMQIYGSDVVSRDKEPANGSIQRRQTNRKYF